MVFRGQDGSSEDFEMVCGGSIVLKMVCGGKEEIDEDLGMMCEGH